MINASEPAPSAALRNRKFFSIEELNQSIRELRDRINQRPFRKREGSRATQFAAVDKPAMGPLPVEPFDLSEWSRARVNIFCGLGSSVASRVQMELRLPRVSTEAT